MTFIQSLEPIRFATWEEPIEMLYACHGKVKRFCRMLNILPDYLVQNGVNQAVKNDVKMILHYFNHAAPLHHEDEEQDFFPALAEKLPQAKTTSDELERQHQVLFGVWQQLSAQLQELLDDKRAEVSRELVEQFTQGYAKHIELEEPLFELGKQHLSSTQLSAMGEIMLARRKNNSSK